MTRFKCEIESPKLVFDMKIAMQISQLHARNLVRIHGSCFPRTSRVVSSYGIPPTQAGLRSSEGAEGEADVIKNVTRGEKGRNMQCRGGRGVWCGWMELSEVRDANGCWKLVLYVCPIPPCLSPAMEQVDATPPGLGCCALIKRSV